MLQVYYLRTTFHLLLIIGTLGRTKVIRRRVPLLPRMFMLAYNLECLPLLVQAALAGLLSSFHLSAQPGIYHVDVHPFNNLHTLLYPEFHT